MRTRIFLGVFALAAALASIGVSHRESAALAQQPTTPPGTPAPGTSPTAPSTGATPAISPIPTASEVRLRGE